MRVALVSALRDSSHEQIDRWVRQVEELKRYVELAQRWQWLHAHAVEGDSVNDTFDYLSESAQRVDLPLNVWRCDTGAPRYGSTEQPERMAALSQVGNFMLTCGADADILVYVESDLIWAAGTIVDLINALGPTTDVVAPLVFAGENFYDVWAFRGLDGARFAPFFPYHSSLQWRCPFEVTDVQSQISNGVLTADPTEVSSVGSCLVMRGEVARECRMRNGGALVDFCADVRARGYSIKVAPSLSVRHPA